MVVVSVFKQTPIMMLLWMDVTHTNRRVRSRGLLEDNGRQLGSRGGGPGKAQSAEGRTNSLKVLNRTFLFNDLYSISSFIQTELAIFTSQ